MKHVLFSFAIYQNTLNLKEKYHRRTVLAQFIKCWCLNIFVEPVLDSYCKKQNCSINKRCYWVFGGDTTCKNRHPNELLPLVLNVMWHFPPSVKKMAGILVDWSINITNVFLAFIRSQHNCQSIQESFKLRLSFPISTLNLFFKCSLHEYCM